MAVRRSSQLSGAEPFRYDGDVDDAFLGHSLIC